MSNHSLSKKQKGNAGDIGIELHERIILKATISIVRVDKPVQLAKDTALENAIMNRVYI
jgi:hypothetical protein